MRSCVVGRLRHHGLCHSAQLPAVDGLRRFRATHWRESLPAQEREALSTNVLGAFRRPNPLHDYTLRNSFAFHAQVNDYSLLYISPIVRTTLALLLTAVSLLALPSPLLSQDTDIDVDITFTLQRSVPSCTVTAPHDLDYGTVFRPGSGSGQYVEIASTSGNVSTSSGIDPPATHEAGLVRIHAVNAPTITITRSTPSDLDGLAYAGTWAVGVGPTGIYSALSGSSDTRHHARPSSYSYYRFGGRVSGIATSTPPGAYDAAIDITVTCS